MRWRPSLRLHQLNSIASMTLNTDDVVQNVLLAQLMTFDDTEYRRCCPKCVDWMTSQILPLLWELHLRGLRHWEVLQCAQVRYSPSEQICCRKWVMWWFLASLFNIVGLLLFSKLTMLKYGKEGVSKVVLGGANYSILAPPRSLNRLPQSH